VSSAVTPLLFGIAAACGAVARHVIGRLTPSWQALLVVNTIGSALLGWITTRDVSPATITVVGVGFCGALTTFSSFALEVRSLGMRRGGIYAAGTITCVVFAASIAAAV
jgi:fluoride exporter